MLHFIVTGGCGFIGSHLVERLVQMECAVTIVDDRRNGQHIVDSDFVSYVFEDVCNVDWSAYSVHRADGIIHLANTPRIRLAFENPVDALLNNIDPTAYVSEWARNFNCPLYFAQSSSTLYSDPIDNPYTLGKMVAQEILNLYAKHWGVKSHLMYFYNVYGPREADYGEHSTVIRAFKNNVLRGESLRLYGTGLKTRDFTYVGDVVEGIVRLIFSHKRPKEIHLGAGYPHSILEIAEAFDHPIVHEFDKPGESQHTFCEKPYVRRTIDVVEYIKEWKKRIHNAKTNS